MLPASKPVEGGNRIGLSGRVQVAIVSFVLLWSSISACSRVCAEESDPVPSEDEFAWQYTAITKQVLLAGIELERFNLNYGLASSQQPKYRNLRYSAAQEAGAAGLLSFEIIGDKEFGKGMTNPAAVDENALRGGLAAFTITSIIAGAGSGVELGSNYLIAEKNRRNGFDPRGARRVIRARFKQLDQLLDQREALVNANKNHPAYARAVIEGKILRGLRQAEASEFTHFYSDEKGYATATNLYYLLNVATTTLAATAGGYAYRGLNEPKFNGTVSVLFTTAGVIGSVAPWLSSRVGVFAHQHALNSAAKLVGGNIEFDPEGLSQERTLLRASVGQAQGVLIPSLPAMERLSLYTESSKLFTTQLDSENETMRHLGKVAFQQNLLAPLIDGTLTTQGILNAVGFYGYPTAPKTQLGLGFSGTVTGTAGAGLATCATAALFLASYEYNHKLRREHRSPVQLIQARLDHINEVEKLVQQLM